MSSKPRRYSIQDIARLAGVSRATVSRVLNDGPVNSRTRARVERIMRRVNYQPDTAAVNLRTGRSRNVGLLLPEVENPVFSTAVRVFHDLMRQAGFSLLLGITYGSWEEELQALRMFERERVSGLLAYFCQGHDDSVIAQYRRFSAEDIPIVIAGAAIPGVDADQIVIEHTKGVRRLVDYLHRTGRRRLAFVAGSQEILMTGQRLKAFRDGLQANGLPFEARSAVCAGEYTIDNGIRLGDILFDQASPDAVVCGNDLLAIGVIRAARNRGLAVPQTVAVTGFDDTYLAALAQPALTTVHQPLDRVVQTGCEILQSRIAGDDSPARLVALAPDLIVRDSA